MKKYYNNKLYKIIEKALIVIVSFAGIFTLIPTLNPAYVSTLVSDSASLFTIASSYNKLAAGLIRAIRLNWVKEIDFIILYISSLLLVIGTIASVIASALSVGNIKFKKLSQIGSLSGLSVGLLGTLGIFISYLGINKTSFPDRVNANIPMGLLIFVVMLVVSLLLTIYLIISTPKLKETDEYEMDRPTQLLLMYMPFAVLIFIFSYLPLWGWRLAFFDYEPGVSLSKDNFVGFKWFQFLFFNSATRSDIGRVMVNTLAMSGLGIITSWLPMFFAMFLAEATSTRFKRFVNTFTTIPNFISWVLIYSLAIALFSTEGFINSVLFKQLGWVSQPTNYLFGDKNIWLKMWAWGTWKGLGWSAIIYIAAISSIDRQMYESARIDGATRFQQMRYITLPSLMPTYFVLLILSVASILSNGMDQYLVFHNATNTNKITVLDLYVYQLGIDKGNYSLSTLIGILKTVISLILLFSVNAFSKLVREESVF